MSETPQFFELRPNNKSRLFWASRKCYVTIGSEKMNHDAIYLKTFIQPCKSMSRWSSVIDVNYHHYNQKNLYFESKRYF